MREQIVFACSQCKRRNYTSTKNKRKHPDRLEFRKYCSSCRTHTVHKETK
ncbi:MAG: 50S ribosomal protein L33 [Candidatus Eisenbacteria bacterium]|nr:50S ribosomal protein L33 [Candidatus Eisenbacteria bacterium]